MCEMSLTQHLSIMSLTSVVVVTNTHPLTTAANVSNIYFYFNKFIALLVTIHFKFRKWDRHSLNSQAKLVA